MKKKIMAFLLSFSMVLSVIPAMGVSAEDSVMEQEQERVLVASYDMGHANGKLTDSSGYQNDAQLVGFQDGDFAVEGDQDQVLNFSGDKGKYVEIPSGLIQKESFAIEATFQTAEKASHWLWCLGTKEEKWPNVKNYVFLNPMQGDGTIRGGIKDASNEILFRQNQRITADSYSTVRLDFESGTLKLSVDGEEKEVLETGYSIQKILKEGTAEEFCGYIGKSLYTPDAAFKGTLTQFDVYSTLRDTSEEGLAKEDLEAITLPEVVNGDLTLPAAGSVNGSVIEWTSSNDAIISNAGKLVSVPQEDIQVILSAAATYGNGSAVKEFYITVKGADSIFPEAYESLTLPYTEVYGNITLPSHTENGCEISWSTADAYKNMVTLEEGKAADGSVIPAGVVTRPADQDTAVTLTAGFSYNGETYAETKDFTFTVKKQPEERGKDTSYLFAHFTGSESTTSDEQIYFAASKDGSHWRDLNNRKPVLTSDIGDKGVRDPYLIRSAEGDKFYLIATDLSIKNRGGWGNAQATTKGSTKLVIWESTDLVNWSEPRLADVASKIPGGGCAWAPEAIYDENTGEYVVYWATASSEMAAEVGGDPMKMYYAKTRDFYTFTEPQLWISRDKNSIIDTTMIKDGDTYYRASGDGQITIEKSKSIYEGWEIIGTLSNIFNNNNYSGAKLEGPEFFKYCEDDYLTDTDGNPVETWGLMCDQYAEGKGYLPFCTTNLGDMTTGSWSAAADVNFDSLKKRHGTVLTVTDEEYAALMKAYTDDPQENQEAEQKDPILQYTFEEQNDLVYGSGATVKSYAVPKEGNENYLYLDGGTNAWAQLPDGFFDGRNKMTISMDVMTELTDGNFFTFTFGQDTDRYYFLRLRGNTLRSAITRSSYNNESAVSPTLSGAAAKQWHNVKVVIDQNTMRVYVDGILAGENKSVTASVTELGKNLKSYLGKSFYSADRNFKGGFDNIAIYNRALTSDEIAEEAGVGLVADGLVGTAPDRDTALTYRGTDDHSAVRTEVDSENKVVTSYVRKGCDLTKIPVTLSFTRDEVTILNGSQEWTNGSTLDLSRDCTLTVKKGDKEEIWTIKTPVVSNNPVLPGQYADPDIDYMDGKFWIFPTTDGYPSWSGTVFHAFSSTDMVDWVDEGIIMDVENDNPGINEKGVQIAASPWSVGSAWAPTIEERNGKYYFYYCAKFPNGQSAIGVAQADQPQGPYTDKGEALVTVQMCKDAGVSMGQAIDPSIFTDDDGRVYMTFGNGNAAIVELNEDMMSLKEGTLKQIHNLKDFRESVVITKAGGKYHWTWSCDDANSPNYHVNYGVSDSLDGTISLRGTLLQKDTEKGILGSAHQSVVHVTDGKGQDRYFMSYHRFYTPLDIFLDSDGLGKHRETCIDEIFFDEEGYMTITPTQEGVAPVQMKEEEPEKVNKDKLQSEINQAIGESQKDSYTKESWAKYASALSYAKEVQGSESADQVMVDTALQSLLAARAALVKVPDVKPDPDPKPQPQPVAVSGVTLNKQSVSMTLKENIALAANILPADAANKKVIWSTSDSGKVTVDQNGKITARKPGTAYITVTTADGGKKAVCKVVVKKPVVKLTYTKLLLQAKKSTTAVRIQSAVPSGEKIKSAKSSKKSIATVSVKKGKLTIKGKKPGITYVTVTSTNGATAKVRIQVKKTVNVSKLTLVKKASIKKGKKLTLKAVKTPVTATSKITWKSSNSKIATVTSKGVVRAKKPGEVTIIAISSNGKKAKCRVRVK